jgi:hypothetical protein
MPVLPKKIGFDRLTCFESRPDRGAAFGRKNNIKEWRRIWKINFIVTGNPGWIDRYRDISEKVMYTAGVGAGLRRGDYMKHG